MYSPRSVSTTLSPAASIARSSADSSLTIDFDLMILATPCRARDVEHVAVHVRRRFGPEHRRTARGGVGLEDFEPGVEVAERALPDRLGGVARAFEVVEFGQRFAPLGDELAAELLQVLLELRVIETARAHAP